MLDKTKFYIDGQWVAPIDGTDFPVINPATEEAYATISLGGAKDAEVAIAAAKAALPAKALLFQTGTLWFGTDVLVRIGSTMGFTERMTAGNQCNRFLVIHRHAGEGLANIAGRSHRVRIAVWTLWVNIY